MLMAKACCACSRHERGVSTSYETFDRISLVCVSFAGHSIESPTLAPLLWLKPWVTDVTRAALCVVLLPAVSCVQPLPWENTCAPTSIRIASDIFGFVARNYWSSPSA